MQGQPGSWEQADCDFRSAGGDNGTVRVWDPATGVLTAQVPTAYDARAVVSFGPASLFIGLDSGVLVVDLADQIVRQLSP